MSVKRRQILAASALTLLSGCLGQSDNEPTPDNREDSNDEYGDPDDCEIEYGEWTGQAEPIDTTVEVEGSENPESDCVTAAANAAFDVLNDETEIDLENKDWAGWESSRTVDGYRAGIIISKRVDTLRDRLLACPDPEFDETGARYDVPSEVTVTLEFGPDAETVTCQHEIEYTVTQFALE